MTLTRTRRRLLAGSLTAAALVGFAGLATPAVRGSAATGTATGTMPPGTSVPGTVSTAVVGPVVDPALQAAIDDLVDLGVPGALVRVRDGEGSTTLVGGVRDTTTGEAPRPGDRFRAGSITKSFTATVLLQLVGEGKLSLDDTVEKWVPGLVPGGDAVKVRQLLNHTSGLWGYLNDEVAGARTESNVPALRPYFLGDWDHVWEPTQLVALATAKKPFSAPGSAHHYTNTNYVLAGLIVEAVTGKPLGDEIDARIIDPLELTGTSFPTTDATIDGEHLHSYLINMPRFGRWRTGRDVTTFSPSVFWAAANLVSTAADIETFYRALLAGELLEPAQQQALRTTVPVGVGHDYGLGLFRVATSCGTAWGHDGSVISYGTFALQSEDGTRQVVLARNGNWRPNDQIAGAVGRVVNLALCGSGESPAALSETPSMVATQRATATLD